MDEQGDASSKVHCASPNAAQAVGADNEQSEQPRLPSPALLQPTPPYCALGPRSLGTSGVGAPAPCGSLQVPRTLLPSSPGRTHFRRMWVGATPETEVSRGSADGNGLRSCSQSVLKMVSETLGDPSGLRARVRGRRSRPPLPSPFPGGGGGGRRRPASGAMICRVTGSGGSWPPPGQVSGAGPASGASASSFPTASSLPSPSPPVGPDPGPFP